MNHNGPLLREWERGEGSSFWLSVVTFCFSIVKELHDTGHVTALDTQIKFNLVSSSYIYNPLGFLSYRYGKHAATKKMVSGFYFFRYQKILDILEKNM